MPRKGVQPFASDRDGVPLKGVVWSLHVHDVSAPFYATESDESFTLTGVLPSPQPLYDSEDSETFDLSIATEDDGKPGAVKWVDPGLYALVGIGDDVHIVLVDARESEDSAVTARTSLVAKQRPYIGNSMALTNDIASGLMAERPVAFRFVPRETLSIDKIFFWCHYATAANGYSKGDGGEYRFSFQLENADGEPDGVDLALPTDELIDIPNRPESDIANNVYRQFDMTAPVTNLTAGVPVYMIATNIHADSENNYMSFNGPLLLGPEPGVVPYDKLDPARPKARVFRQEPDGSWTPYPDSGNPRIAYAPVWAVRKQGTVKWIGQDMFYGEFVTRDTRYNGTASNELIQIKDQTRARQRFTPDRDMKKDVAINMFVGRISGTDPLEVWVDGIKIASINDLVAVPDPATLADRDSTMFEWLQIPHEAGFINGVESTVELRSIGAYRVGVGVRGEFNIGGLYNVPGQAEYSADDGATWNNFHFNQNAGSTNIDLSLWISENGVQDEGDLLSKLKASLDAVKARGDLDHGLLEIIRQMQGGAYLLDGAIPQTKLTAALISKIESNPVSVTDHQDVPTNATYMLHPHLPVKMRIDETFVKMGSGTATVTFSINGAPLAGGSQSATINKNVKTRLLANEAEAGSEITYTVSAVSGAGIDVGFNGVQIP